MKLNDSVMKFYLSDLCYKKNNVKILFIVMQ